MGKIVITADSTIDLSEELLTKYSIDLIPLYINMDGNSYRDGVDVKQQDVFDYFERTGTNAATSAVPVQDYIDRWSEYGDAEAIIHIDISAEMSTTNQNANIAAREFNNVHVVDSRNLSSGSGHIAIAARELADKGVGAEEIVKELREVLIPRLDVSFILDTLIYLHRGGRCSTVAMLGANLLKLKPCIEVEKGTMHVGKKYRGSLEKCTREYVRDRLENRDDLDPRRIFITCTGHNQAIIDAAHEEVEKLGFFKEIIHTSAGCTVGSHCGPDTIGVLFFRKNER